MSDGIKYYVVKKKAIPDVLLKVVEAKKLLDTDRHMNVQKATEAVGISRSSFYKYKDDIFPFHENTKGQTITMVIEMRDEPGLLSRVLRVVAFSQANILTIHQSIPVNEVALLTLSVKISEENNDVSDMLESIEELEGINYLKILARE
ncbi:MAG: ACT domain-containing protein [Lachnospiraceae bacterium]